MKKYIFKLVTTLFLVIMFSCNQPQLNDNEQKLFTYNNWILVNLNLNGKDGWFIVDTGSMLTILDSGKINEYQFSIGDNSGNISGFGGQSSMEYAYNVDLKFNNVVLSDQFFTQDIKFTSQFEKITGKKIVGILGGNILSRYQFIIDYTNNVIKINI